MNDPWHFSFEMDEWAVIYGNRRYVTIRSSGVGKSQPRYTFGAPDVSLRVEVETGSASKEEALALRMGSPDLASDPRAASIIAAVERGDYSWLEPPRTEFSVSVFVPLSTDREVLVSTLGAIEGTALPDLDTVGEDVGWVVLRTLPSDLVPRPGTEGAQRLATVSAEWDGYGSWEVVTRWPETLGEAMSKLAAAHDVAMFTVKERFRDRATMRRLAELADGYWLVDWQSDDDLILLDDDVPEPLPPVELKPGWRLAAPVREWAVEYDDGCVFTCHGHRVSEVDGRYLFLADTEDGDEVQIGSASVEPTSTLQPR